MRRIKKRVYDLNMKACFQLSTQQNRSKQKWSWLPWNINSSSSSRTCFLQQHSNHECRTHSFNDPVHVRDFPRRNGLSRSGILENGFHLDYPPRSFHLMEKWYGRIHTQRWSERSIASLRYITFGEKASLLEENSTINWERAKCTQIHTHTQKKMHSQDDTS